ncbi:MAG TPA: hypothetical protein PKO15_03530 [Fibrobacteria bacterium]|nr:hypothetical protein [Fibrobacteria bacterium]
MKRTLILAGLSCGLAGVLAGCEGASSASLTSSPEGSEVAGRVGISQAQILVADANGDTVAKDSVKGGAFVLRIPGGTHFPVVLDVDSAGVHLKTILPGPPAPALPIHITPLTDSAARALLGHKPGPGPIGPKEWKDKLDSLRPVVSDSLRPPKPPKDTLRPLPPPRDSLDTLRPPPPPKDSLGLPKPPKDTLRPLPPPRDSLKKDTLRPPLPPKDSLGLPKPPKDTLRPLPPPWDSLKKDTLRPPPPLKDSLGLPKLPKDTLRPPSAVRDSILPAAI